jgi:DNA-binding transcriptional regulator YiaG
LTSHASTLKITVMKTTRGNLFKQKRQKLGLTQQAAANHLCISLATWCRWESGLTDPLPEHRRLLELLDYGPSQPPHACVEGSNLPWNSDDLRHHLESCKPCKLRLEFLHHEMDWE